MILVFGVCCGIAGWEGSFFVSMEVDVGESVQYGFGNGGADGLYLYFYPPHIY